ncbi:MAG: ParB/RepB/Spo0J family partition protein [Chitinophagaceae bacterium]|nr:ParB/RepB/Spo0J family partition protein [Chitinophagaceae bacterium]MCW5915588.1 ParB/RepB/Spo0J family partition protein [Chitinophagaceae bacterium]MCZ2397500.1 ParB/RepB/Spo0J family partition protein [Chitinophagales bacterium]
MEKKKNIRTKKDELGKGIRSLLQTINTDLSQTENTLIKDSRKGSAIQKIPLADITANPDQPRRDFDETALRELAQSIKVHDIIQPLTVMKTAAGKYRIIAGERRFRAAKLAGLTEVPVYIRETDNSQLLELALLENLQREDLNAIEIALSYRQLVDDMNYTQEQLAERMGKERSTVTNYLRLLKLPPDIQAAVRNNTISMGHARALVNVDEVDKQLYIFSEIKSKGLSVRQTEDMVRKLYAAKSRPTTGNSKLSPVLKKLEDNLASHFGTRVIISQAKNGKGSITFDYSSIEELNGLLQKFDVQPD